MADDSELLKSKTFEDIAEEKLKDDAAVAVRDEEELERLIVVVLVMSDKMVTVL